MPQTDLKTAIDLGTESSSLDYKRSFDVDSSADWLEVVKDIVAMANSGGGMIIVGIADDGSLSDFDCEELKALDPASITDKIFKYTGHQFNSFTFLRTVREGRLLFAIEIGPARVPIVFSKPGTYDIGGGKQKSAFSVGTTYFRHGAKSEPGNSDDFREFIDNRIEEMRTAWFKGIVKVVEAPLGSEVQVTSPQPENTLPMDVRLVNDANAPAYRQVPHDKTHPHRQKEVVAEFNKVSGKKITSYHIQCVRRRYNVDADPTFCYRMQHSSPQYSQVFVDWLVERFSESPNFFEEAKGWYKQSNMSSNKNQKS